MNNSFMEFKLFQDFGTVLTTKGYISLEVLDEKDKLLTFNENWELAAYPVNKITRRKFSGVVNRFCSSNVGVNVYLHKNTLVYCGLNGSGAFVPCKTVTHSNKPVSVGVIPTDLFDVVAFPGIVDFWCLVYGTPINQVRHAYNSGIKLHGVSPLVLYQQLSREYYSKFFNGLLKLTEDDKIDLLEKLTAQEEIDSGKNKFEFFFRSFSDALNFGLMYAPIAKCTACAIVHRTEVSQFRVTYYKNEKLNLDERGCFAGSLRHNHVKQIGSTEVIINTDAPHIVYGTLILKEPA